MKLPLLFALLGCGKSEEPKPAPLAPPIDAPPPATPDQMIKFAVSAPVAPYFTTRIELRYITADARLDPKYGTASVKVGKRREPPPPPPDDPKRPLGAPPPPRSAPTLDELSPKCPHLEWNGNWFREAPSYCDHGAGQVSQPRCTVAGVIARARTAGAPAGALATIVLSHRGDRNQWLFEVRDDPRNFLFTTEIEDDCGPRLETN